MPEGQRGIVHHSMQAPNGILVQPFIPVTMLPGWRDDIVKVACACDRQPVENMNADASPLHIIALAADNTMMHTIRINDQHWQNGWFPILPVAGDPGPVRDLVCTAGGGILNIYCFITDGRIMHAMRSDTGWRQFEPVAFPAGCFAFDASTIAGNGLQRGTTHLIAVK